MVKIRKMQEADLDEIAEVAAQSFQSPWSRQGFAEALPMENACFFIAEEECAILGYCGLYMAADECEIINVAVCPKARKRGIADLLLRALIEEGHRNGVRRFFLEVRVSNEAAICLYEKHGFSRQGIRKNFYQKPCEDAYVMNRIDEENMSNPG